MVNEKNGIYVCEECDFEYKEKKWAEKCETWCKKYRGCNLEITKHSVGGENEK